MGYIRHHAIVVTSWDDARMKIAHEKAKEIFGETVSPIVHSTINGYTSFFVAPDGSKEGWDESDNGDAHRKSFIDWINKGAYDDGSNSLSYSELYYGDDEGRSEIVSHN